MRTKANWSRQDQVQFFETLGDLLKSGYSLQNALNSIQTLQPKNERIIGNILIDMQNGISFEQAVKHYVPDRINFQLSFVQLHGNMRVVIQEIGTKEYIQYIHYQKLKMLLFYPGLLLFLVLILGLALFCFFSNDIWHDQANLFLNFSGYTTFVILIIGVLLIILCILGFRHFLRITFIKYWSFYLKIPVIKDVLKLLMAYYFLFHMGTLLKSGVSLSTVIRRINRITTLPFIEIIGGEMQKHLMRGDDLVSALREMPFLPKEAECLFETGKTQAMIGCDFVRLVLLKKNQLDRLIERLLLLIQPIGFGCIGCLIIMLYLKFLLPIYSEMGDFSGW